MHVEDEPARAPVVGELEPGGVVGTDARGQDFQLRCVACDDRFVGPGKQSSGWVELFQIRGDGLVCVRREDGETYHGHGAGPDDAVWAWEMLRWAVQYVDYGLLTLSLGLPLFQCPCCKCRVLLKRARMGEYIGFI